MHANKILYSFIEMHEDFILKLSDNKVFVKPAINMLIIHYNPHRMKLTCN